MVRITKDCRAQHYVYHDKNGKSDPTERRLKLRTGREIRGELIPAAHGSVIDIINLPSGNMVFVPAGSVEEI